MGFETNGSVSYNTVVCSHSRRKKQPCRKTACKHHVSHVPFSQSGVEFFVRDMRKEGACLRQERD